MFLGRDKKNNVFPCKPQFYYIKVGFKGVKIIWACFRDAVARVYFFTPPARLRLKLGVLNSLSYTLAENVPNMLDWGQVRESNGATKTIRIVLLQKLLYYPLPMGFYVVIMQHDVVMLKERQNNWL